MTIHLDPASKIESAALARVARMLYELAQLTGADVDPAQPILTMEFDSIVTLSRVAPDERGGQALLTVSALLPPAAHPPAPALTLADDVIGPGSALLWDHNGQRHVIVRWTPAAALADERSLLDTIMATGDLARAWYQRTYAADLAATS